MIYKIACLTPVAHIKGVLDQLKSIGDVVFEIDATKEQALNLSKTCNVFFVNPNKMTYKIDRMFFENSKLKHIITASTGTNHIEMNEAKKYGVQVYSLTKHMDVIERISSTAEHALALTLALIRNIPASFEDVKNFNWNYEKFIGRQIDQLAVGVIGYGRLGKKYVRYMEGIGAIVEYSDPKYNQITLEHIFKNSDIISLHVHLDENTKKMINLDILNKSTKKPFIINTSRGEIVDEKDIITALYENIISGYATDVIEDELGNIQNSELIEYSKSHKNVIITPHIGGMTTEAQEIAYNSIIDIFKFERKFCDNK